MPTYEYKCPAGHTFEKFFPRMNDRRHLPCPTCGKRAERVISGGAGLVFKGSGFYITDYKRAGEKQPSEGDAKPASESKPAAESKPATESKPAPEAKRSDSAKKKTDSGGK
jgi:putative FmdB family regulatory protein